MRRPIGVAKRSQQTRRVSHEARVALLIGNLVGAIRLSFFIARLQKGEEPDEATFDNIDGDFRLFHLLACFRSANRQPDYVQRCRWPRAHTRSWSSLWLVSRSRPSLRMVARPTSRMVTATTLRQRIQRTCSGPSRPRELHPEPLTDSVREPLDSYGSCHRMKAAAFH
jgi:hypothetical protein